MRSESKALAEYSRHQVKIPVNAVMSPADAWTLTFTRRLMDLQPELGLVSAIFVSRSVFRDASSTPPQEAADSYAAAFPARPAIGT
jgi:hypothetical protein